MLPPQHQGADWSNLGPQAAITVAFGLLLTWVLFTVTKKLEDLVKEQARLAEINSATATAQTAITSALASSAAEARLKQEQLSREHSQMLNLLDQMLQVVRNISEEHDERMAALGAIRDSTIALAARVEKLA